MTKAAENKKKISIKTHPKTPCNIKSGSTTKRKVRDYLTSVPKTELLVGGNFDRSEPSPRFASNDIHTKSGADNLQGNGLKKGPGASQVLIKGSQNPGLSNSLEHFLEKRDPKWHSLL